jgi:hypothetical protein
MPRNLFPLLGQLLPCILLILMGWGLGDLSRFFSNPARVGLVAVMLITGIASSVMWFELHPLRKGTSAIGSLATAYFSVVTNIDKSFHRVPARRSMPPSMKCVLPVI